MRTSYTSRQNQSAVAAVEFILTLPIILMILVLIMHTVRIGHLAEELAVETRSIAWREALHNKACILGATARESNFSDHTLVTLCGEPDEKAADKFLSEVRDAGRNEWANADDMTQVLANTAPAGVETTSATLYRLRSSTGNISDLDFTSVRSVADLRNLIGNYFGVKLLITSYGVDARDAWLRGDLQLGFDNYYDNRFKKHILFPDYFPCATGNAASAEKPSTCTSHDVPEAGDIDEPIRTDQPDVRQICLDGCNENGGLPEGQSLSADPTKRAAQINSCRARCPANP